MHLGVEGRRGHEVTGESGEMYIDRIVDHLRALWSVIIQRFSDHGRPMDPAVRPSDAEFIPSIGSTMNKSALRSGCVRTSGRHEREARYAA